MLSRVPVTSLFLLIPLFGSTIIGRCGCPPMDIWSLFSFWQLRMQPVRPSPARLSGKYLRVGWLGHGWLVHFVHFLLLSVPGPSASKSQAFFLGSRGPQRGHRPGARAVRGAVRGISCAGRVPILSSAGLTHALTATLGLVGGQGLLAHRALGFSPSQEQLAGTELACPV